MSGRGLTKMSQPLIPPLKLTPFNIGEFAFHLSSNSPSSSHSSRQPPSGIGINPRSSTDSSTVRLALQNNHDTHIRSSADRNDSGDDNSIFQLHPTSERCNSQHENNPSLLQTQDQWRPAFLKRRTIYGFVAALAFLITILEAIFIISEKRHGLDSSSVSLHYIWTYGPTAIFTCFGAVWACVDYEAKAIAPWLRPRETRGSIGEPLFLDYLSMFSPLVPLRALRNRDLLVAACTTVSHLFKILTILGPSLIMLMQVNVDTPAALQTHFVDDTSRLSDVGLMPLYNILGFAQYELPWPDGSSENFAYQSVVPPPEGATGLRAVVDGLSFGMNCQVATLDAVSLHQSENSYSTFAEATLSLNISSSGCSLAFSTEFLWMFQNPGAKNPAGNITIGRLFNGQCEEELSTGDESWRLAFVIGKMNYTATNNSNIFNYSLGDSDFQQLVCKPSYNISDIEIVQQDTSTPPHISLVKDPRNRTLEHVHAWDLAGAIVDLYNATKSFSSDSISEFTTVASTIANFHFQDNPNMDLDRITTIILGLSNSSFPDEASYFDANLLEPALTSYFRMHGILLSHDALMDFWIDDNTGAFQVPQQRLVVKVLSCQLMVGLCVVSACILLAVLKVLPRELSFAGDPGTILGTAVLSGPVMLRFPSNLGAANLARLREILLSDTCTSPRPRRDTSSETPLDKSSIKFHQPISLHPVSRLLIAFITAGAVALLEALLQQSAQHNGIGPVYDRVYLHYLWTILPTIVLSLIGLYFSSVDWELRTLIPFDALRRGSAPAKTLLNPGLLGKLYPQAIHAELRTRNFSSAFTSTASLVASLLAIAAGSLFVEMSVPVTVATNLRVVDAFSLPDMYNDSYKYNSGPQSVISSLVLESNLSYPPHIYEGLAFPTLIWEDQEVFLGNTNITSVKMTAVVPAMRSRLNCYKYSQSDISATFLRGFDPDAYLTSHYGSSSAWGGTFGPAGDRIVVNITGEFCSQELAIPQLSATAVFYVGAEAPAQGIFGASITANNILFSACSGFLYLWGNFNSSDQGSAVISASAVHCNLSMETVETDTVFSGPELEIDITRAPSPREDTVQVVLPEEKASRDAGFASLLFYTNLVSLPTWPAKTGRPTFLDPIFSLLTSSRYAIPADYMADAQKEDEVVSAIQLHHNIIMAQAISQTARVSLPSNTTTVTHLRSTDPGGFTSHGNNATNSDNSSIIQATITDYSDAPKCVQMDATATRVLEALLGAVLGLSLLGWALMPRTAILPRPATSIVGTLALIADGNLLGTREGDTGTLAVEIREDQLLMLGWGPPGEKEKDYEQRRFGIWAMPRIFFDD